MQPQVEVISGANSWRFSLETERTTIGKAAENDVALERDAMASHRFAASRSPTDRRIKHHRGHRGYGGSPPM